MARKAAVKLFLTIPAPLRRTNETQLEKFYIPVNSYQLFLALQAIDQRHLSVAVWVFRSPLQYAQSITNHTFQEMTIKYYSMNIYWHKHFSIFLQQGV